MPRSMAALSLLALPMLGAPALAAPPPANAKPLSEVVRMLEEQGDVAYIEEVEWDDDGHWDIEYVRAGGGEVDVEIDPVSGQPRR